MFRKLKIFFFAAIIFSLASANVSAAPDISEKSEDNLLSFMTKVNKELKANNPDDSLDTPAFKYAMKYYEDVLQVDENLKIKLTYAAKDEKIYSVRMNVENFDDSAKTFFEGMNIVFLKAFGLSEEDSRELAKFEENKTDWRHEKFVETLKQLIKS